MPFLPPNQQRQSTEGTGYKDTFLKNSRRFSHFFIWNIPVIERREAIKEKCHNDKTPS